MAGIELAIQTEFPEATAAEVRRFVRACQDDKKDSDQVKEAAESMLEDYLDWRSCFGLDYKKEENGNSNGDTNGVDESDAADWKRAIEKALEVNASMKRAKELEKKLAEEAAAKEEESKAPVEYNIDLSDSQKAEDDQVEGKETSNAENSKSDDTNGNKADEEELNNSEMSDEEKKRELAQIIFMHKNKDGQLIADKEGSKILHVIPALINRQVAHADFYALALSLYLERKLDRESEDKMTVLIDMRPGDGWPNPAAIMMIRFVHRVTTVLQRRYPERLQNLILYPVPWAAMGIWAAMKQVFALEITEKVTLVAGSANRGSPLPKEKLEEKVDGETLELTEQVRLDHFKPIGSFVEE